MLPNATSDHAPVLITGGAGFVGTPLANLIQQVRPVVVVDDLSVARSLPEASDRCVPCQADIRDRQAMTDILLRHRPATVIHLAAIHHIPTCETNPFLATEVNVMGFQSVLDACAGAGCGHVVLASSGAVYDWHDGPLDEDSRLGPCDVYAASKAANEHQLTAWVRAGKGHGSIARMFNVIGPNDPNGHLIPDILRRLDAAQGNDLVLAMGNLDRRRDFVDVRDMAAGLQALANRSLGAERSLEVVNLCRGQDYTAEDIALRLAAHRGLRATVTSDPALRRTVDRPSQLGNPAKAEKLLGWKADRDLDDSIAAIVASWYTRRAA